MNQFDYILIFAFTLIIIVTGISFSRTGKNMKSFFAGGGNVPWWISGLSLFMSFFSAGTFVVWGSIAYLHGMVAVAIQSTMAVGGFLIYAFIAKRWRRTGVITAAEFITQRFGVKTQKIFTYLFVLISFFTAGAFLYPVAKIVNVSTGYPINAVILFLGFTVLLYTAIGGFWAVLATDVLQFVILTAAVLILVPLSFKEVGGISMFVKNAPENFFKLVNEEYNPWFLFAFMLYNFFFIGGNWAYVQRYTSVKDEKAASKVGLLMGILYIVFPLIWMLPPMIYRLVNPTLVGPESTEGAYLLMCQKALPAGMMGLMIAGMVFATASSVNTTLNMMAAVTTNDLYKSLYPKTSDKKLIYIARLSTILFGIGTIVIALLVPYLGGIVNVVLTVAAITGVPLFAPPVWGLFSKRLSGKDLILVTSFSLMINLLFKFLMPFVFETELSRANEQAIGAIVPLILLASVELWKAQQNKISQQYISYSQQQTLKINSEAKCEDHTSMDKDKSFGIRVISLSALVTGGLIFIIGFVSRKGEFLTHGVGCGVMLLAMCTLRLSRKKNN